MVSRYFDIREFVPPQIWDAYHENSEWFIDYRIFKHMDFLREYFDRPIIINNWHTGGGFQNRGFRLPDANIGAQLSQHKFGRAIDFNVQGIKSDEVFERLKNDWVSTISRNTNFTTMEDPKIATSWTHIDMRCTFSQELLIVKP